MILRYILLIIVLLPTLASAALSDDKQLAAAVKLALNDKYSEANKHAATSKYPKILQEYIFAIKAYKGPKEIEVKEFNNFIKKSEWLPKNLFIEKFEKSLTLTAPANRVISWYAINEPHTTFAKLHLLNANVLDGGYNLSDPNNVVALKQLWISANLDLKNEEYFIKKYKNYLTVNDCLNKVERLIWDKSYGYAEKLLSILPEQFKSHARLHLYISKHHKDITLGYLATQPQTPFVKYLVIRLLLDDDRLAEAYNTLKTININNENAKHWWLLKNKIVREFIKQKKYSEAYLLAADNKFLQGADYAEAEWLSGWLSLRFLQNSSGAVDHFYDLYNNTKLSSTRSKASYWLARSYESLGQNDSAQKWYAIAAKYNGTFYGHLAMYKSFGVKKINYFSHEKVALKNAPSFERVEKLAYFITLLAKNNNSYFATAIIKNLPNLNLTSEEYYYISNYLYRHNLKSLNVELSKIASNYDSVLLKDGYPSELDIIKTNIPKALILSIVRQESNFNQDSTSTAGAKGMMQIMPSNAERLAKILKINKNAYLYDYKANILKGSLYINELYKKYNNLVLTLAAYNAGPGSVDKWMKVYGDIRDLSAEYEIIDWIESIPFVQTRNYVKKVLENFIIYDSIQSPNHNTQTIIAFLGN